MTVLALGVLAAGAYVYATVARPPTLDQASLCPVDGPHSVASVLLGGTIPEADIPGLKQAGIAEIFLPGTSTQDIVNFVRQSAARKTS